MSKYNWKQLEKEYMLGDFCSVSSFLRYKQISNNRNTQKKTKGWRDKKKEIER